MVSFVKPYCGDQITEDGRAGHVACMWEIRISWSENLKVRDHSKEGGVDGRIILKCILEK
jgi:hypothetical protein